MPYEPIPPRARGRAQALLAWKCSHFFAARSAKKRSLFPSGVLQVRDVLENGYWHARSLAYLSGELPRLLEWLRLPGNLVFIFLGALPILLAVGLGYLSIWSERPQAGATRPAAVA
jgi:nitric oxide reductase large subunit